MPLPRTLPAIALLVGGGAWLAWSMHGMHEDGFFILRMVEIFLHTGELAYNPGERYEANTDFLWTLLLIPGPALGLDIVYWAWCLGMATYVAALLATYALARRLMPSPRQALIPLALLTTHYSFARFAASGYGIDLLALAGVCALLALWRFGRKPDAGGGAWLGCALSFMALCRLDAVVLGAPVAACALWLAHRAGRRALGPAALALGIPAAASAALLSWKLYYYGDILPATYYVKGVDVIAGADLLVTKLQGGLRYSLAYWRGYSLWLPALAAAVGAWSALRGKAPVSSPQTPVLLAAAGMVAFWHGYVVRSGGGFHEYRLFMSQAPQLMLLVGYGLAHLRMRWAWAAVAAAALGSAAHATHRNPLQRAADVPLLDHRGGQFEKTAEGGRRWRARGNSQDWTVSRPHQQAFHALAQPFAHLGAYPREIRVGYGAGGFSSYTTRLLFTERLGFADSRISLARPGEVLARRQWWWEWGGYVPGHSQVASPLLMARLGANLMPALLDDATDAPPDFDIMPSTPPAKPGFQEALRHRTPREAWALLCAELPIGWPGARLPADSQLLALELPDGRYWPILYFNRNATIDAVLDANGIRRYDVYP